MPTEGPYADYYPEDSISAELLRLLPPTVRPTKRVNADGNSSSYFFPLASPAALREALERNGGKKAGLDVNKESYLYSSRAEKDRFRRATAQQCGLRRHLMGAPARHLPQAVALPRTPAHRRPFSFRQVRRAHVLCGHNLRRAG